MTSSHCLVRLCLNCCLNGEQSSIDVSVPLPLSSNTWQDNRGLGRELERAVPNPEEFILEQYLPCHSARPPGISHWPAIWPQPYRQWLRGETVVSCVNGGYCCCLYLTRNKKFYSGFYNIVHVMGLDVSVLVVLWFICVWFAERSCYAKVCIWYTFTGPNPDGTAHLWPLAFWVVVLWSNEEKLLVSSFNSQLVKSSSARVSVFFFYKLCLCVAQKLEEAAANATEEERRRLQTQNELQDLYRVEMEKEKMVLVFCVYLIGDCLASFLLT